MILLAVLESVDVHERTSDKATFDCVGVGSVVTRRCWLLNDLVLIDQRWSNCLKSIDQFHQDVVVKCDSESSSKTHE